MKRRLNLYLSFACGWLQSTLRMKSQRRCNRFPQKKQDENCGASTRPTSCWVLCMQSVAERPPRDKSGALIMIILYENQENQRKPCPINANGELDRLTFLGSEKADKVIYPAQYMPVALLALPLLNSKCLVKKIHVPMVVWRGWLYGNSPTANSGSRSTPDPTVGMGRNRLTFSQNTACWRFITDID